MGILDDAIKEHLELKRQHGAGESELKQLEDEAFGESERPGEGEEAPDPFAEAPTEFMSAPGAEEEPAELGEPTAETGESPRRDPSDIASLQEAPEPPPSPDEPAEEEQPAMEHEIVAEPAEPSPGHSTEERHAIAEQPTEMFDVEDEIAASESRGPSEEELVEETIAEPRLAPVDPLAGLGEGEDEIEVSAEESAEEEEEDDFFDEKRLYEELDQALEAPLGEEDDEEAEGAEGVAEVEEADGHGVPSEEESNGFELLDEDEEAEEPAEGEGERPAGRRSEDLLEDTPDFLEDAPEDDQLWFEQKPPKDFDFDD
jgi:hypothetical protein